MTRILLKFGHGLGDAVQLGVILRHLRHYSDCKIDVSCGVGKHSVFRGLAERTFRSDRGEHPRDGYDRIIEPKFWECHEDIDGLPSTKVTKCLLDEIKVAPILDLYRYDFPVGDDAMMRVKKYLQHFANYLPVAAIHYQGNTSQEYKDLRHDTIRKVCELLVSRDIVPIILDWDRRSPLPDGEKILCPDARNPLWLGYGTGDGETLAALISQCVLMVGIDSGPLHVAGATNTPTIGVWTRHHPVHFFDLSPNVMHLVPPGSMSPRKKPWHDESPQGPRCLKFFREHYRHVVYDTLDKTLLEKVEAAI